MSVVLITGCSSGGIGWHLAKQFAMKGCKVYATARDIQSMDGLVEVGCSLLTLDVTKSEEIKQVVEHILKEVQQIDVLVNNAGLLAKAPVVDADMQHYKAIFNVNFFGALELIHAVAPGMMQRQSGTIINIGSIASYSSQPFWSAYSSSKSAIMSLTDALRTELKPFGVKVVYCAPGFISTQLDTKSRTSGLNYINPKGPYSSSQQVVDWVHKTEGIKDGTPPDTFAQGFVDMALSRTPPAHYVAGKVSWLVWFLGNFMPLGLMDSLYMKATGLQQLMRQAAVSC